MLVMLMRPGVGGVYDIAVTSWILDYGVEAGKQRY